MWPAARSSVPEPEGVPAHVIFWSVATHAEPSVGSLPRRVRWPAAGAAGRSSPAARPAAATPTGSTAPPRSALDQDRDAVQRPHVASEPVRQRALQQRLLDPLQLLVGDLGAPPGRPAGSHPRVRNPAVPSACQRPCQRPALWRETSSWRATWAWVWPWANSSAARSRRAWRAARCWAARFRACCLRRLVDVPGDAPTPPPDRHLNVKGSIGPVTAVEPISPWTYRSAARARPASLGSSPLRSIEADG
jgi:hypothetical protein